MRCAFVCLVASLLFFATSCSDGTTPRQQTVVVYTALDRVYSEPLLDLFEQRTGIKVLTKYDAEAAKTTGLINQLIARRDDPEADVLWNNEVLQTEHLARMGLLQPYESPEAARFDAALRHPGNLWTGFAGRLRVCIYNTDMLKPEELPDTLDDLTDPKWRGRAAVALPFFGTTFTHMCVLRDAWGAERLTNWLAALRENDTAFAAGNGPVRDLVASGERALGLTDSDDAYGAILDGRPVAVKVLEGEGGRVMIPNTVALIADCPHPNAGKALIDFLLSAEVERLLAEARSAQIPLANDLANVPTPWDELSRDRGVTYDVSGAASHRDAVVELLRSAGLDG